MDINEMFESKDLEIEDGRMYVSEYAAVFDETCIGWTNDPDRNHLFLKYMEGYFNCILKLDGFVMLKDVYDYLGIVYTEAQARVGWLYDEKNPVGDNFIDLDLCTKKNIFSTNKLLDPNVDGCITNLVDGYKFAEMLGRRMEREMGL